MAMKHFFVGVKAVIVQDGKVLLVRGDNPGRDFWDTPGGRIDDDESILETLDRELHEELPNIASYRAGKVLHVHRVHKDIVDDVSLVLVFHEVTDVTFNGDPQVSEEHTEAAWLPIDEVIQDSRTVESVRAALETLRK